jgi:hypothetical protein
MRSKKNMEDKFLGDEAPRLKDFLIVIVVVLALIALSWIAYYKFKLH